MLLYEARFAQRGHLDLDRTFPTFPTPSRARALADPTRLMLAAALEPVDELCVCDLAWIAERSQNLVSHHLRALRAAGLVDSRREGKMVLYALTTAGRALLELVLEAERETVR
jgi:ArsR family transcriptional regulator, lead/cadmium/zinc/bismuth-responsive transcriptional repressor